jgi:DNA-binding transcriptional regulator LsrR (DeoR family)
MPSSDRAKNCAKHYPKSHYRGMDHAKAAEIRRAYFAREANQAELARRYGIAQNTVSRIVSGLVWVREVAK